MAPDAFLPPCFDVECPTVAAVAQRLGAANSALRNLSALEVCRLLGEVNARWASRGSPFRREAVELLAATTGYARRTLDRSLRHFFGALTEEALRVWVGQSAPNCREIIGPPLIGIIAAGNLPGTAIPSLIQALLLRSTCLVKSSSAEPHLMASYARAVAQRSPELASAIAVLTWPRADDESTSALLRASDALIAYGSDASLAALRSRYPIERSFIGYGHRLSCSVIGCSALSGRRLHATVSSTALDIATFDQQGCLSPQAIFVERGGDVLPSVFAGLLAEELERLRTRIPRRPLAPEESSAIHQFRAEFEMRMLVQRRARLWQSEGGTDWTVALASSLALEPCPLNRTALVYPYDSLDEVAQRLSRWRGHLISCGAAVRPTQLSFLRSRLGITRLCRLGEAQFPSSEEILMHDGINALRTLWKERLPTA